MNNRMLIDYTPFNRETVIALEAFLGDFQAPMCFVGKITLICVACLTRFSKTIRSISIEKR
jgi:hypothetical protein